jgi:hypothetical protein
MDSGKIVGSNNLSAGGAREIEEAKATRVSEY